jgi:hypothetical protein
MSITPLVLACDVMLSMSGRRLRMPIWTAVDGQLLRPAQGRPKPAICLLK